MSKRFYIQGVFYQVTARKWIEMNFSTRDGVLTSRKFNLTG